jgi:lipopolysaccharide/colanic/teichoic acid biosynthesis glycosyltransferase
VAVVESVTAERVALSRARTYPALKRPFDLVVAGLLLAVLSPLLLVIALLVCLTSRGPILFRQERVGEGGRRFRMLKFRSMSADAPTDPHRDYAVAYIQGLAPQLASEQGLLYKLASDPRVTPVGRILRKLSLDELPQLWNVVRGEMSLVGPRPPLPYEVELYQPAHRARLEATPGMTGLWQVSGRNRTTFEEMVALDLEYIERCSLAFDLRILARTIPVVLFGDGGR